MKNIAKLPIADRQALFINTASKTGLNTARDWYISGMDAGST